MLKFNFHRKLLVMLLVPLLAFTPVLDVTDGGHKSKMIKWAVQKTSSIRIQGSTNVNSFGCDIVGYYQSDTIFCSEENASNKPVTLNGNLQVNVLEFDCHNKMLTGDLRKTLKASEYPTLTIRFLSLERAPIIQNNKDYLRGWVEITLAGNSKRFEVNYSFVKNGSTIQLNGNRCFSFADFKLTPPNKMLGLIKVKDKFNVDFNLSLNPVN